MGIPAYMAEFEGQYGFVQVGNISSEQAELGVDERDNATVAAIATAKKLVWQPDDGTAAALIRFRVNGSENNQFAVHIYGAKGADYYTRVATLTCDQGTQDWSSGHFVDVITASNETWQSGMCVNSVTNGIGRVFLNTCGYDRFLFISPDLTDDDIANLYIDIARLDQRVDGVYSAIVSGLSRTSTTGGTQKITLSSGTGQGSSQVCRTCMVKPDPANTAAVRVNLGGAADADDGPLDAGWISIPVDNCSDIYFYSTDADAIVYILWRD